MFERAHHRRIEQLLRSRVDGEPIKFEIIREARIAFERPSPSDQIAGVDALTPLDMAASKLLANCDRWADDSTNGRDVIDLAMMTLSKPLLAQAIAKAETDYGDSVVRDLRRAIGALLERPGRLSHCMKQLSMQGIPRARLWQRLEALRPRQP